MCIAAVVCATMLPSPAFADTIYYLNTGQPGANVGLDALSLVDWYSPGLTPPKGKYEYLTGAFDLTVTGATPFLLGGGNFDMKGGTTLQSLLQTDTTTSLLTLALYQDGFNPANPTANRVAWVTWTAYQFCQYKNSLGDDCQSYDRLNTIPLYFTDTLTHTGSVTTYLLQTGHRYELVLLSNADHMGSANYFIKSPDQFTVAPYVPLTPEPGTLATMAGGFAALCALLRRRSVRRAGN